MEYATLIRFAELAGICVFSITGALAAQGKRMDILGVVVLAIVTALGGGTVRDITLNETRRSTEEIAATPGASFSPWVSFEPDPDAPEPGVRFLDALPGN